MFGPRPDLDLGAVGRELDHDRLVAEPPHLAAVGLTLPGKTVDGYQFTAEQPPAPLPA